MPFEPQPRNPSSRALLEMLVNLILNRSPVKDSSEGSILTSLHTSCNSELSGTEVNPFEVPILGFHRSNVSEHLPFLF